MVSPAESGAAIWRWLYSPTWYLLLMDLAGSAPKVWVSWGCRESSSNFIHERVARLIFDDITPKNTLFWGVGPSQPQIQNCDWFSRKAVTFFSGGLAAANSNHNLLKITTPLVWLVLGKTRHNFGRWGGLNRFFSECHLELVVIVYLISFDFMMDSGGNPSHVEIHAKFQSMIEISQFWSLMVFHSQGALTMISEQSSRRPMILNGSA